ncbi:MAG: glycosyl transferase [Candidatus Omnitrophica bacterium]|nr:glycosyl transferase [Candidatus Omnitrophota bacterium]
MKYGYFDDKNKEYVVTRPDTPTPWMNYLGLDEYCAMISNTAGGYSFHKDPRDKRILRYRYNNIPQDRPGRYIYLREQDSGEYWSATWNPLPKPLADFKYVCRHGLGYTLIKSHYKGIETQVTYFVPLKENLEVWIFKVVNTTKEARRLTIFSYAEFCLWQAMMDQNDFQYSLNIANCACRDGIIYHMTNYYPKVAPVDLAFFGASIAPAGFDCDREKFIGPNKSEANPAAVEAGHSFGSVARGGNPIGSHSFHLELGAGETKEITFVLGVAKDTRTGAKLVAKFSAAGFAETELARLKENWRDYLNHFFVSSPDKDLNTMVNTWNAYQCRTTFNWSRSASYYESGIGRGMGFRDSNQDCLGVLHTLSSRVRQRIIDLAKNQFKDGSAYHQYSPLTKKGDKTGYSDDHLWLIVSTAGYLKESGDFAFLNEKIAFADGTSASLYKHLARAVKYSLKKVGRHGIPLMGYADWNDCLNNMGPGAESVWVGQFLCFALKELARMSELLGKKKDAAAFLKSARKMQDTINKKAWDGQWYTRAFDAKGRPVGSKSCKEGGNIYLNSQSWAVLADITERGQQVKCMDMVKKYLDTEYGIMLLSPPYKTFYPYIGAIGTFAQGLKENGGIFCHANPWAMIAEAMLGRAENAFSYYKKMAPTTYNDIADIHMTEPYIYSQFIAGRDSHEAGRARNSWLTGSATWNYIAATWYILGIQPDYKGLKISPCIPKDWKEYGVRRHFRGAVYDIKVKNPRGVSTGVSSITVDAKMIEGNVIPSGKKGTTYKVEVTMGGKDAR